MITEEITEKGITEVNTYSCIVGNECSSINLNQNSFKSVKMKISRYSRDYIVFTLDMPVYLKKCEDCEKTILEEQKEYILKKNDYIYLETIKNKDSNINYAIVLYWLNGGIYEKRIIY